MTSREISGGGTADLVLRGGTVVDGTGAPPFVADVAITNGRISDIGVHLAVAGKEEFDAAGLHVAPGWIDPHTHLDAQWSWDPYLDPVSSAGVTTCIMGNCGIGFAPCQADRREFLAKLMEAVEDIPGPVIESKLEYDFETFEEYLDSIARKPLACDVAVMIGHSAVRTWVMGKRASLADRPGGGINNPILPHEIEAMAAIVRDAVASGALGFSTSRLLVHRDPQGTLTPGALAGVEEVKAICRAIVEGGGGTFEMSTDWSSYDDVALTQLSDDLVQQYQEREAGWMVDVAREHGKRISFTYNCFPGDKLKVGIDTISKINSPEVGGLAKAQSFLRTQGFLYAFEGRIHPFVLSKAFQQVRRGCRERGTGLCEALREPATRASILDEVRPLYARDGGESLGSSRQSRRVRELAKLFQPYSAVFRFTSHYEPAREDSVASLAAQQGVEPIESMYDLLADGGILWKPQLFKKGTYNSDRFLDFMERDDVIPGFGDAGAHNTMIQDAVASTHTLTHWVRDRTQGNGRRLPIEVAVKKQTADVADLFGLPDVGRLVVGKKANLNVFDMGRLLVKKPVLVNDWMQRWTQSVEGYVLTMVAGVPTYRAGVPTGALPGGLVRNPRADASKYQAIARKVSATFDGFVPDIHDTTNSIDGMGEKGGSAAARLMRETVERDLPQSRL